MVQIFVRWIDCQRGARCRCVARSGYKEIAFSGKGSDDAFELEAEKGDGNPGDGLAGVIYELFEGARLFYGEEVDQFGFERALFTGGTLVWRGAGMRW